MSDCLSPGLEWLPADTATQESKVRWALPMGCCSDAPVELEDPVWLGMQAAAIEAIDRVTHRRYGGPCLFEVRPCPPDCCRCQRIVCCCGWDRMNLQQFVGRKVRAIASITVNCQAFDGEVDPADYRLDNQRYLTPIRGGALWPWPPQDLNTAAGDDGTWYIHLVAGNSPNQLILQAAADVACSLWGICQGRACDVPTNAVSISREGVTITLESGMLRQVPSAALVMDIYQKRVRPPRIWDPTGPKAAVREIGGGAVVSDDVSNIVISDSAPPDTTVVWIDTSGA